MPEVTDFLCRMERITRSFCTGCYREKLFLALRSSLPTARCGVLAWRTTSAFGGVGGAHDWIAAGVTLRRGLDAVGREALREELVQRLLEQIKKRCVDRVAVTNLARSLMPVDQKDAVRVQKDLGEGCHDIA